jgi:hypothetical protein
MLTIGRPLCRRDFLRIGGLGLSGLTLADRLRYEARADGGSRPKSVIYIVLGGGRSSPISTAGRRICSITPPRCGSW